jgi:hypothetical protein
MGYFPSKIREKVRMSSPTTTFKIVLKKFSHCNEMRKRNEIHTYWKRRTKSLYVLMIGLFTNKTKPKPKLS